MTAKPFNLLEHESKAMSEGRLGVIVRPASNPTCTHCGNTEFNNPDEHTLECAHCGKEFGSRDGHGWGGECFLGESPFGPPGTTLEFREEWDWQDRHQGSWTIEDFERNGGNVRYKADGVEPFEKWIPASKMPNRAIRFRAMVGEVRCVKAHDLNLGEWLKAGYLDSLWEFDDKGRTKEQLMELWEEVNHGQWKDDPWLWLCEIKPKTK